MPIATPQTSVKRGQYRLPIEALQDEKKLKAQLISMSSGLDAAYLVAEAVPVPGLGSIVLMAKGVWESAERVQVHRETLAQLRQKLVNLCYLLAENQMTIDLNDVFMQELDRFADIMEKDMELFSRWGMWKSWLRRYQIGRRLAEFDSALEEIYKQLPALVRRDQVSPLREDLRTARSSSEIHALEEQIYNIRMDPAIDTSSLPADLSIEVKPSLEKPISGSQYIVRQGKWLNRDIVALKFPKNFGALRCSMHCGGTQETCCDRQRHDPAAKAMEAGNAKHYCRAQQLSDIQTLNMIRDIALGLRYIHSKGVVHAALSPKNVLIQPDGTAVIGDFSRAKIVPPEYGFSQITDTSDESTFMRYQAPEEQRTPRPMSPEGDIFAWSMVSLEIISKGQSHVNSRLRGPIFNTLATSLVEPYLKQATASLLYERIMLDQAPPSLEEHRSHLWEKCSGLWELIHSCHNYDRLQRPSLDHIISKLNEYIEKKESSS
ncbi:hypothetical protein FRC00_004100 [Tulasnella sp. 408]|nr:hypothetical protein FRC00_004100 [Tulasnella sp. 408]